MARLVLTNAYVTTSKPKFKWVVKNEREFVKWVKSNISSEIVETVRESSRDAILEKFHYINGDDVIDPNGERVEWLEGTIAEPYLVTKFHSDGRERLKNAFQSGTWPYLIVALFCSYQLIDCWKHERKPLPYLLRHFSVLLLRMLR